jgi:hypothetical protein
MASSCPKAKFLATGMSFVQRARLRPTPARHHQKVERHPPCSTQAVRALVEAACEALLMMSGAPCNIHRCKRATTKTLQPGKNNRHSQGQQQTGRDVSRKMNTDVDACPTGE